MKTFAHPAQDLHSPRFFLMRGQVRPNFEVPGRAAALAEGLARLGLHPATPPEAPRAALEAVHPAAYLDFLRDAPAEWAKLPGAGPEIVANVHPSPEMLAQGAPCPTGLVGRIGWYTADTACPIGPGTWAASAGAAACALAAAAEAAAGRHAYALCRPPGHHTYAARAGGHCYLNNAAIAVEALKRAGAARVAVLDIDSHHGNGTQGIFWERADVLTVSVHGDPAGYYPWYVGTAAELGGGAGLGCNLNLPLAQGSGDAPWLAAIGTGLTAIRNFGADALVVSLGFDASEHEPLNFLSVTADGFASAGRMIAGAGLAAAIIQEGGYNVDLLGALLERFLNGWNG
ncbi:histone deacetylase family protein [Falsiroseomonas selenitidurans]|uniref:Histone deacetylase family protein n=1 Tax=Falsiroseomonas selenitidurans TaxID=2716335 RepID=A0ABX1E9E4_9PROT|nr:histone deacetylase family protein [Falsiroseomonas selenitidurans]NKC31540.1 histone deacetylase family protein [Falsiroseomonas selenitidurans]